MDEKQFKEFTEEIIPQQLFHVEPTDYCDDTGGRLDEVILVGLIAQDLSCLKHKPLQWFIDKYLLSVEEWKKSTTHAVCKSGIITPLDFDNMSSREKWDIWESIKGVKWVCNNCNLAYPTDASGDYWDGKRESIGRTFDVIECGWCGNVLTHRTNGGQSDPFEWTFEKREDDKEK